MFLFSIFFLFYFLLVGGTVRILNLLKCKSICLSASIIFVALLNFATCFVFLFLRCLFFLWNCVLVSKSYWSETTVTDLCSSHSSSFSSWWSLSRKQWGKVNLLAFASSEKIVLVYILPSFEIYLPTYLLETFLQQMSHDLISNIENEFHLLESLSILCILGLFSRDRHLGSNNECWMVVRSANRVLWNSFNCHRFMISNLYCFRCMIYTDDIHLVKMALFRLFSYSFEAIFFFF